MISQAADQFLKAVQVVNKQRTNRQTVRMLTNYSSKSDLFGQRYLVPENLGQKIFGKDKFVVLRSFWSKKFLVLKKFNWKNFCSKKFWLQKCCGSLKIFFFGSKTVCSKRILGLKIFCPKKKFLQKNPIVINIFSIISPHSIPFFKNGSSDQKTYLEKFYENIQKFRISFGGPYYISKSCVTNCQ